MKWGLGGVTIHVRRLRDFLDGQGVEYAFRDYKIDNLRVLIKAIKQSEITHLHVSNPSYQLILVLLAKIMGKKVVMTLHGNYGRFNSIKNMMVRIAVKKATVPIVINELSYSACKLFNKNTVLIPAFIPPQKDEDLGKDVVGLFNKLRKEAKVVYVTNASNVAIDKYGNEIYGIDFLVQYFKDMEDKALVISDPSGNYQKKYENLHSNSVFFINYPHSYYEVLKRADCSIRNTSTDGDALSVKESLYLGVKTLCTDVVDRPQGVQLFKYCDRDSFEVCLHEPLGDHADIENGAALIVKVYKNLTGRL